MKKNVYIVILFYAMSTYSLHAETFINSLSIGSTGEDVLELQKILNSDNETQITTEGIGSPNNETFYFGELTKQAVIKFQNKYAQIILKPLGISEGTGYVGASTLTFLNLFQKEVVTTQTGQPTQPLNTSPIPNTSITEESLPTLEDFIAQLSQFIVSKTTVSPGGTIVVGSQNNIKDTTFFLNTEKISSKCPTDFTCELRIDKKIKPGVYTLSTDNTTWKTHEIKVLDSSIRKPVLKVKSLSLSKENLLKGKKLTPNIKIYTMYGLFTSETKNNSFILAFPTEFATNPPAIKEGLFYIENDNGLTSDILDIRYEI